MDFDKLVHQPTRLQVFAYLYRHGETSFSTLVADLEVTEGNLSSHLQTMEDADAISVTKAFVDRTPRTTYALTPEGRALFEDHIGTLEALLESLEDDE